MGKGIDAARAAGAAEHADVIEAFKEQLLVVFLKELKARGHSLVFPVAQVDATGNDLLAFAIREGAFVFDLRKKS